MTLPDRLLSALFDPPTGTFTRSADSRRYLVSYQVLAGGKSHKLVMQELDGARLHLPELLSDTGHQPLLRLCEMPAGKVTAFGLALTPDIRG